MKLNLLVPLCAGALAAYAQPPSGEPQIRVLAPGAAASAAGPGGFDFVHAEASFEAAVVKGVPFAGDFVTENSQVLSDGNRIRTSTTSSFARDGEGRTRREVTMAASVPLAGGGARKTVFIHDPVAKIDYILDPQNKTARKIDVGALAAQPGEKKVISQKIIIRRSGEHAKDEVDAEPVRMPLPPGMAVSDEHNTFIFRRHEGAGGAATGLDVKNEPLGKRNFDGVEGEGTRTTVTIPAGSIGNDRAIDTISERWYSKELRTTVMTTRKDPRTGESTYRLTNLRRGEPSRQLFEVPPDYKIVEGPVGGNVVRMRVEHKE